MQIWNSIDGCSVAGAKAGLLTCSRLGQYRDKHSEDNTKHVSQYPTCDFPNTVNSGF